MAQGEGSRGSQDGVWRPSIGAILTVGFGALVLAAVSSVLWISLDAARDNTFALTRSAAELIVASITDRVDKHLGSAQHQLDFIAGLVASGELDATDDEAMMQIMLGSLAAEPAISGIAFIRPDHEALRVGYRNGEVLRFKSSWGHRPEIVNMVAERRGNESVHWVGVAWVTDLKEPHVVAARSLYYKGTFQGVLSPVISIRALSEYLADLNENHGTNSFIVTDRDKVLAHPMLVEALPEGLDTGNPLPRMNQLADPILPRIWDPVIDDMRELLASSSVKGHVVSGPEEDLIFLFREVSKHGPDPWIIGTYYKSSDVNLELRRLILAAFTGLAILIAAVFLALLLGRALSRPVGRLAAASAAIRDLDFRAVKPLPRSFIREIDSAAGAYNSMLNGLRWFETYVPRSLVMRLLQRGETELASEERQVTVLFTDIAGFTRMSTEMDAAALAAFLNRHFALLAARIEAEGGTVDKYIGDSVMAFWGAPEDQPDHAERGCRAALRAAAAIAEDNVERAREGLAPVRMRMGLHSGPAIVGNIGAPGRVNYTLIGDTVNTAQRLEGLGKEFPDEDASTILISGATRALIGDSFTAENLGSHQLRGRKTPTPVFRLRG